MMRDPLPIVQEYLASGEAQVRKNAALALAVIGTRDAFYELVRLALQDPDEKVRKCAEDEIQKIDGEVARPQVLACLYDALDQPETQGRAGLLLARCATNACCVRTTRVGAGPWRAGIGQVRRGGGRGELLAIGGCAENDAEDCRALASGARDR